MSAPRRRTSHPIPSRPVLSRPPLDIRLPSSRPDRRGIMPPIHHVLQLLLPSRVSFGDLEAEWVVNATAAGTGSHYSSG
ncbi:hypothetical protein XA68_17730 [Ophiocordyceps unilateralis]|uniref:Uncharacterized protein n=1 Tax=Ophiocordyceps unilateralis TaxID=268505 RepID=A0A2A9P2R2_OPHUN|nr:hypothetical protein XA68_17730 [Ophiocordyceps unilateralis]